MILQKTHLLKRHSLLVVNPANSIGMSLQALSDISFVKFGLPKSRQTKFEDLSDSDKSQPLSWPELFILSISPVVSFTCYPFNIQRPNCYLH